VFYDYGTAFGTAFLMAIGAGLAWLGIHARGESVNSVRRVLSWPFLGLGIVLFFAGGLNLLLNFFGPLILDAWIFLMWLRSFF
jgi:hypothetical protein